MKGSFYKLEQMMKQDKQVKSQQTTKKTVKDFTERAIAKSNSIKKTIDIKASSLSQNQISGADKFKILIAIAIFILSVIGYYYFKVPNQLFRHGNIILAYLSPILGLVLSIVILLSWCSFGKDLIIYIKEATIEFKKMVWPDRKTATRMTLLVVFFVFILALYMWISDSLVQWFLYDLILRRGN